MGESLRNKRLYKTEILLLKVLPILIALCYALNSLLSYFDVDLVFIGYVAHVSLLPLTFLYTSSYVFRFCGYHRMFLHYIVVNELINTYDYYIGIPITNRDFFILGIGLADSKRQLINTIVHEAKHVQSHICRYYDVPEDGEQAAYLIGYIVMRMYNSFKQLI